MITTNDLRAFVLERHKPEAQKPGLVWQIWEDGELTLRIAPAIVAGIPLDVMPVLGSNHSFAFIENEQVGKEIREKMLEWARQMV